MDILMVFPSGGDFSIPNFSYNLGSAYIIAFLRQNGYKAEQFIAHQSFNIKECVNLISTYNPKIVGFTVYDSNFMQCAMISKGLKAYNSDILVIFGGPNPSVQSKEILESVESVDICVKWEGEEIVLEILSKLSQNNFKLEKVDLKNIQGISFRDGNEIIINPDSKILLSNKAIKNYLDKYPSPYLSKTIPTSEAARVGIITARGCNQNCVYCNCAVISNRNIFFHSIDRVIEELKLLNQNLDFKGSVPIMDDAFTMIPTRAKEICERIIENDINIPLSFITRCDKITEDLLDLMKQAGFISVGFSLESAVPKVLRAIGKLNPPNSKMNYNKEREFIEKLRKMSSYAKKIGMRPVFLSIMVGLPEESPKDAKKTLNLVKQLDFDYYTHNYLHIFKGTPLYQTYMKYGYEIIPMGQKNRIITRNNFPFDIYKIKLAPRSENESKRQIIDYKNLKLLSLNPKRKDIKPYFENIIINSNVIKSNLVHWIQENLIINGTILHLYSNKRMYKKNHERNTQVLFNDLLPTLCYERYILEKSKKALFLKSKVMLSRGTQIGVPIIIKKTHSALEEYKKQNSSMGNVICIDQTIYDSQKLYDHLTEILRKDNSLNYLLECTPLPHFHSLCRWTSNHTNCQVLETAIIDKDDSIRICWHSDPIGTIGENFIELKQKMHQLFKEKESERNCINCIKNETCVKCLYPEPLSSKTYCEYIHKNDIYKITKLINSLDLLKDLIHDQVNCFEI